MTKTKATLEELANQIKTAEKPKSQNRDASQAAVAQREQLRTNIAEGACELEPYQHPHTSGNWEGTPMPTTSAVQQPAQIAKRRADIKPSRLSKHDASSQRTKRETTCEKEEHWHTRLCEEL